MRELKINASITNINSASILKYFGEVKKYKTLSIEEEAELGLLIDSEDEVICRVVREKLVKHNLRFVISVAKQYQIKNIPLEDLINEGNLGLIKASERFDPTRGFKFISYAVWWIRQYILAYITDNGIAIKLPRQKTTKLLKIKQECSLLEQKLERLPSEYELKENLPSDFNDIDFQFYLDYKNDNISSLDEPLGDDKDSNSRLDYLSSNEPENHEYFNNNNVKTILDSLNNERQSNLLTLLYGLNGEEPKSINEISEIYDISSQRVRVMKEIALRVLKYKLTHQLSWLRFN